MTDDLIAFVTARLDEYEHLARSVLEGHVVSRSGGLASTLWDEEDVRAERDLREIAFKRAILAQWQAQPPDSPVLTNVLYHLAAIDSDHADYRPEWKP